MLICSMPAESTAATAQAMECWRIRGASSSRRSAGSSFESRSPRMRYAGSRITAAATTGPNSDPRPTSSTPATWCAPAAHARFSKLSVQRSFFSRRNLAADAESFADFDGRLDVDTGSSQHLRRRRSRKQEQTTAIRAASVLFRYLGEQTRIELMRISDSIAWRSRPVRAFFRILRKNRYANTRIGKILNCNDVALTFLGLD